MTATSRYPLPAYSFQVNVGELTWSFAEVSGIELKHETVTYRHGLSFREGPEVAAFLFDEFAPVTFRRGIVQGATELLDWLGKRDVRAVDVSLVGTGSVPVVTWHLGNVVPVKLSAPSFDARTSEVAIESLEVMARAVSLVHTALPPEPEGE